ncbi:SGNH/GDSL hydrolase family protein [Nocardioides sp. AE5]|uniref:SGNH/GDSL hydrolase family protein n=1 Tax=Nocardioides sp. AE5 TaxID=2962573 RepID=UPI002880D609|nr:SGNH/GDSL hydrolase family protein [Nocardioides sp. AE5]MDT0202827.1 SGNH/GDSL hydrolase family protein [Nocardioides sp. AE5]
MPMTRPVRRTLAATAAVAAALVLAGCPAQEAKEEPVVTPANWRESGDGGDGIAYVALGDSYVTAPGVPQTDANNPCFPSSNNYPALVAAELEVATLVDASCGGASTVHMSESQGPGRPPQFDALDEETDLVTITIGGNDEGVFASLLTDCVVIAQEFGEGSPCREIKEGDDDKSLLAKVEASTRRVDAVLAGIVERAPNALVVVVGYPQLAPASGACPDRFPITEGDMAYARELNVAFNTALAEAAANHGAEFVDMFALSEGHDICADDPWVNGAVDLPDRAAAYHPFAAEQEAAAAAVVEVVRQAG